jgi:hypothetical protein
MALSFLRPGSPNNQLVGDLHTAKSAIFVGVLNGIAWSSYLEPCLSDGAAGDVEQRWYCLFQLANYLTTMLGVALLVVGVAFSATTVISSPVLTQVVKYTVWITKVLTGATLQFGLSVLHSCLRMWGSRLMLL